MPVGSVGAVCGVQVVVNALSTTVQSPPTPDARFPRHGRINRPPRTRRNDRRCGRRNGRCPSLSRCRSRAHVAFRGGLSVVGAESFRTPARRFSRNLKLSPVIVKT